MKHLERLRKSPWLPFLMFALGAFVFFLLCTRLFIKTDDGHFLGLVNSPGFELLPWLRQRYVTNSGRSLNEAMMMTFLQLPLWLWQLCSAALLSIIAWFLCKISGKPAFSSALPLLILPTCLAVGVFWFAGSFTFLWPMAMLIICIMPAVFRLLEVEFRPWLHIVSFFAAPIAASSEQAAAAVLAMLVCLNIFLLWKKNWKPWFALPVLPAAVNAYFLFASPGAAQRSIAEAQRSFPAFLEMALPAQFLAGLSNYLAYALFLSIPVMTVFLLLLYTYLQKHRRLVMAHGIAWAVLAIGGNLAALLLRRQNPDMLFEAMFAQGQLCWFGVVMLGVSLLFFASIILLLILLIKHKQELGLGVGLCFAAAVGCAVAPGFSGSLYASGQRIFFFSEVFLILAIALLFGQAEQTKHMQKLQKASIAIAVAFAIFQLASFQLLEIPFMG